MKIAALGDAHLGRSYYSFTTPEGVNQRERDFEVSFEAAVELALAQDPDLMVWLGDIFDHPRPTYRSYRIAQRAIARIREHGVPLVVITGNHDTPRLPGTGSPYSALADTFPEFHFAHRMAYERFDFPGLSVHAVPQMLTVDATLEALDRGRHGPQRRSTPTCSSPTRGCRRSSPATPTSTRSRSTPRLLQVRPGAARPLPLPHQGGPGHLVRRLHRHVLLRRRAPTRPRASSLLDTDSGECRHIPLAGQRPLVTLPSVQALGLSPAEVEAAVLERAAAVPAGAVARLYLEGDRPRGLPPARPRGGAGRVVGRPAAQARAAVPPASEGMVELPELQSLPAQWAGYVEGQDLTGFDRPRIRELGDDYLARAIEAATG